MSDKGQEAARPAMAAERIWRDMVAGRLVVQRHEDENGRRYLYLQPAPQGAPAVALTERERLVVSYRAYGQSLKRIAFELGVSVPTVTRLLAGARRKLGLHSDLQLPAVFGSALRARKRA